MVYQCYALPLDADALTHYGNQLGLSTEKAITALAQAIALHPMWKALPHGMLVARTQPTPSLGVIGMIPPKSLGQIKLQQASLTQVCQRLRYVSYPDATAACEQLAERLIDTFGLQTLSNFRFCGIPRGGLIILGMLAYTLGLSQEQMTPPYSAEVPLVIVDDCALSGSRFARTRSQHPHHKLIFAPLYSHPDLRRALINAEPQVLHCLSGQDLFDHGPSIMGTDYRSWQTQNRARLSGQRYWLGLPDYLCFPWNEPDHLLWNPLTEGLEQSWHILPPAYCLKNRPGESLTVQHQPRFTGWLQPTMDTIFGTLDHQILIGNLATGETFGLSGKAAEFWSVLLHAETLEDAIATLAQHHPESNLREELTGLIDQLISQNILCEAIKPSFP
jgi:hypothetical protein